MKVDIKEKKEDSEVELKIEVSARELEPHFKEAAKKLSKEKSIKGFRPGKAPVKVVEEVFGLGRLVNEVIDKAVPTFFVEAVMDHKIDAIARPAVAIDEVGKDKGLKFTATVAVLPEVKLGDLSQIEIEKRSVKVTDKEVDQELNKLAKMRSNFIDVARPAKKGDTVKVDFKISMNGTPMEGGAGNDQLVHLGEGYFVPDFENNLVGIQAGDEREFKIKFPDDYKKNNLGGKEADAWVKAKAVQKRVVPEINDEFAKKLGKFDSAEHLKSEFKKNLEYEKQHKERERRQGEMTEKLAETAEFTKIPDILIDKETDRLIDEFKQMLTMQQRTIDDYLKETGRTMEQVKEEMKPSAEKNVRIGLALRAFAKQESIEVSEEELEDKVQEYLHRFGSSKEAEGKVNLEELREQLRYMIRNQKAMDKLEEKVTIIQKK